MWKKIKPHIISVAIALLVGGLSALLTKNGMEEYQKVNQPPLSPPMIVFPIVWTILFTLMGISSAIIYEKGKYDDAEISSAIRIYGLNLIVNFFWSIIFFNLGAYLFAFIWLLLLLVIIILMIVEFYKISKIAALIQIPYLLWVAFAGYLNFMIYLLNK